MKKILLAVDESEFSRIAVEDCLERTWPDGTEFHIVFAVDFFEPLPAVEGVKEQQIESARELVKKYEESFKSALPGVKVEGSVVDGLATSEILHIARDWKPDLIIMGSQGRSGVAEFLLGSVSKYVLTHAHCSVRIVRKPKHPPEKIVVIAIDSSEYSHAGLEHVMNFPWEKGTNFLCVSVVPAMTDYHYSKPSQNYLLAIEEEKKQMHEDAKEVLNKAVARLTEKFGAESARALVLEDDPREQILICAETGKACEVVLGSHSRRGVERLLLGSVSESVATHAHCTVTVVRLK